MQTTQYSNSDLPPLSSMLQHSSRVAPGQLELNDACDNEQLRRSRYLTLFTPTTLTTVTVHSALPENGSFQGRLTCTRGTSAQTRL